MRILMLGNSFTSANNLPAILAQLTGAEVHAHTRGGARLAEHLNPSAKMGKMTREALHREAWDAVILQEMSNGPITSRDRFFRSVDLLCRDIHDCGAIPVLFATWGYRNIDRLSVLNLSSAEMAEGISEACREAAARTGAFVADVGLAFSQAPACESLYAADGVHPSMEGSRLAARILAETVCHAQAGNVLQPSQKSC